MIDSSFKEDDKSSVQQTLRNLPVTVLWLDGNHENFDLIDDYPEDIWHGGRVHTVIIIL